jgi:hypothetical protein
MLRLGLLEQFEHIAPAANATVGRRCPAAPQAEQCLESRHRLLAAIVPKDELVEVRLQLGAAHAVIRADQPLLEIPDGTVGQRHHRPGTLAERRAQRLFERDVVEPGLLKTGEASQAVGVDRGAGGDVLLNKRRHGARFEIGDDTHSDAASRLPSLFDRHQNRHRPPALQLSTATEAGLRPADPGVVDLHFAVERLAGRVDHRPPQLMEHHPRGFVPSQTELSLQQKRRDPPLVGRHQIGGPEPLRQRDFGVVQNRPGRQGYLMPASRAFPPSLCHEGVGTWMSASRTAEPVGPPTDGQVLLTRFFRGELTLKLAQISWKRRARYAHTLLMVAS